MLMRIAEELGPWTWWVVGLLLLALEVFAPGTFFLWFGIAAILVGAASLVFDWSWQLQLVVFAVLALVLVVAGRRWFARTFLKVRPTGLNERAERLVGQVVVLAEPIADGYGRARVEDTTWRVKGPDLPAGRRVRITGTDGVILMVEAAE